MHPSPSADEPLPFLGAQPRPAASPRPWHRLSRPATSNPARRSPTLCIARLVQRNQHKRTIIKKLKKKNSPTTLPSRRTLAGLGGGRLCSTYTGPHQTIGHGAPALTHAPLANARRAHNMAMPRRNRCLRVGRALGSSLAVICHVFSRRVRDGDAVVVRGNPRPSHQGYILSRALPEVINPQCRTSTLKSYHLIQSCFLSSLPCSSISNGTNQLVDFSRLSRSDIYTRGQPFSLVPLPLFAATFLTTSPSV
ncbi:hypothetical protein BKA56DRAFT_345213 [Ilyonectria sp. MPI-CAGE-AT-0026]|nr:hypothetical protein BKA56DRAFT_345213 [Ilyonectria sp. MPI-CAGE-AT-0026]